MADEVEISNVGGTGVASEVTLAKLLDIMEAMAKKKGINPDDVNKKLKALSESTDKSTEAIEEATEATEDFANAANKASSRMAGIAGWIGGGLLSGLTATAASALEMGSAFASGSTRLEDFVGNIPLVGGALGHVAKLFDESFSAFQSVAGSGAAFNNSLTELRGAAAGARMPLAEFTSMIQQNSDKLASFGGTATGGALQIVKLNKALGSQREDLLNMGLSYQDINEALIDYQYLQRAGNRGVKLNQLQMAAQADSAARYTKNLVTLSKLTGEDIKSQQAKIAAAQMDVAMQAKLGRMSADERAKMDILMANTLASGGQAAVDALKREFLGMPPLTEEAALFTTQFGEQVTAIKNGLADVTDSNVSGAEMQAKGVDYMMDMINGASSTFARLEPGMSAAAAGLDGPMAAIADQLTGAGIKFTDFIDENGRVDQQRLRTALEASIAEGDARDATTNSMVNTQEALSKTREAFETSVVSPLMQSVAPALESLTQYLSELAESEEFQDSLDQIQVLFGQAQVGIEKFVDAFKEDPKKALSDLLDKAMSGIGSIIGDAIGSIFTNPKVIAGMVLGVGALWATKSIATAAGNGLSNIASRIFGGGSTSAGTSMSAPTAGRPRAGNAGRGAGNAIGNIGGGIGKGLGGVLKGLAGGISAFANPAVALGAAGLSASIVLIGGAIAGATWMVGKSLPTMAEGMKSFEEIDGAALIDAGKGMAAIGAGLLVFGGGSALGGAGNVISNIFGAIPGKGPLEKLKEFSDAKLDTVQIENNANAMMAYSKAMAGFDGGPSPSILGAFKLGIVSLLGGETDPMAPIKRFGEMNLNTASIIANAGAVAAYAVAIKDFPKSPAADVLGAFKSGIASLLGGETDPMAPIKRFGEMTLNTANIIANAEAVSAYADAVKDFPKSPAADVFSAFKGAVAGLLGGETDPMAPIKAFGDMTFNTEGIIANAGALSAYADAVKDFPTSPSADVFSAFKGGLTSLLGGNKDPMAPIKAFGEMVFNTAGIIANASALSAYANAVKDFPTSPSADVFSAFKGGLASLLGGETDPMAPIKAFGDMTLNTEGIIANAGALKAYADAMKDFPDSPAASVFTALTDGIIGLLGGETDPFAPMEAFGNRSFNTTQLIANADAVSAFATAMANMPEITTTRSGGALGWLKDTFAGDEQMPWDKVTAFGAAEIDAAAVVANANAMSAFATALIGMPTGDEIEGKGEFSSRTIAGLERISALTGENITSVATGMASIASITGLQSNLDILKSGLDTDGVISYNTAMQDLVDTLSDLNKELSRDNNGMFAAGTGTNAGSVMSQTSSTPAPNLGAGQLNSTMQEVLKLLEEMRDLDIKVERNTADAAMGTNIAARSPSRGG